MFNFHDKMFLYSIWYMLIGVLAVNGFQLKFKSFQKKIEPFSSLPGSDRPIDYFETFSLIDKVLFQRFGASVSREMGLSSEPKSYYELINMINKMVVSSPKNVVNEQGKNILIRLFPKWLLDQYIVMFSRPFPAFSARMNAWVTHWTTNWLMGNSTVYDIVLEDGRVEVQQGLLVEKCRFLEESKCLSTCIHACKIPTQRFFLEGMGLPVTLSPNVTDYSCKFEFGHMPLPLEKDDIYSEPCLSICPSVKPRNNIKCMT